MFRFTTLFMLALAIAATWITAPMLNPAALYHTVRTQFYADAPGVITQSAVRNENEWALRYNYEVDGRRYEGDQIGGGALNGWGPEWAAQMVREHPAGARVNVRYDPAHPGEAALDTRITGGDLTMLMVMTSIFAFVAGFWGAFVSLLMVDNWAQEAGGQPVSTDASGATHVQMPNFGPLRALSVAALFVPFVMIFPVLIAGGTVAAAIIGWVFILAILIAVPVLIVQRRRAGRFDIVFDKTSVVLPAMHGRKTVERIPRADIENVHHWYVVRRGRGGGYLYRVSLKTKDGREPMLAEWHSHFARAEALAKWLSKKLGVPYADNT